MVKLLHLFEKFVRPMYDMWRKRFAIKRRMIQYQDKLCPREYTNLLLLGTQFSKDLPRREAAFARSNTHKNEMVAPTSVGIKKVIACCHQSCFPPVGKDRMKSTAISLKFRFGLTVCNYWNSNHALYSKLAILQMLLVLSSFCLGLPHSESFLRNGFWRWSKQYVTARF